MCEVIKVRDRRHAGAVTEFRKFLVESADHISVATCENILCPLNLTCALLIYNVLLNQAHLLRKIDGEDYEEKVEYENGNADRRRYLLPTKGSLCEGCVVYNSSSFSSWNHR